MGMTTCGMAMTTGWLPWMGLLLVGLFYLLAIGFKNYVVSLLWENRRHRMLKYEQQQATMDDMASLLQGAHSALTQIEDRLVALEQQAVFEQQTLGEVLDKLATRSRSSSRKVAREET